MDVVEKDEAQTAPKRVLGDVATLQLHYEQVGWEEKKDESKMVYC
jgi:hypothetical protein